MVYGLRLRRGGVGGYVEATYFFRSASGKARDWQIWPSVFGCFIDLLIYLYIFNHDQFKATFSVVIALDIEARSPAELGFYLELAMLVLPPLKVVHG